MSKKTDIIVLASHHVTGMAIQHLLEKNATAYYYSGYASSIEELRSLLSEISEGILIYDADAKSLNPQEELLTQESKAISLIALASRDHTVHGKSEIPLYKPYRQQDLLDALEQASEQLKKQKQDHLMKSGDNNIVCAAIQYIAENLQHELTLEDIAAYVYITPSYLSRLFKSVTGENIFGYISHARLEMAKSMLRNTNDNINVIAANVGYDKINSFNQFFKRSCGLSPSAYRQKCKNEPDDPEEENE